KLASEIFFRILNRPATPREVEAALGMLNVVDQDNRKLTVALEKREKEMAEARAKRERERETAMAEAKLALDAYEKETGAAGAEAEKKHDAVATQREADLRTYEATLPAKISDWEKKQSLTTDWVPLAPTEVESDRDIIFKPETDFSVSASIDDNAGDYIFTA